MAYPGIVYAILVGVAVGAAVYAFFAGEHQPQQYRRQQAYLNNYHYGERYDTMPDRGGPNSNDKSGSTKKRRNSKEKCSICLEQMDEPLQTKKLDCNHEFHTTCITLWFRQEQERLCPLCRSKTSF